MNSSSNITLSCIIPVLNEKENIAPLTAEMVRVVDVQKIEFEIIFVDDGSTDGTYQELSKVRKRYPQWVRIIKFRTNFGKSAAYDAAFKIARGNIIATLDGDGQDNPSELDKMILKLGQG